MEKLKVYLKVFLTSGILFGLSMGGLVGIASILFIGIQKSLMVGVLTGVASGTIFGLLMSLILSTMHIVSTNKILVIHRKNKYLVRQISSIDVAVQVDFLYDNFISQVKENADWLIYNQKSKRKVELKTSATMRSFGEIITVTFRGKYNNLTEIEVVSRPKLLTTIVDYGKNLQNILTVEQMLKGVASLNITGS
ncbi:MAG: hypothetical protein K0S71_2686 [Clostridia bacterium]|jgi:hypothetical protein|nr:hypothetical protein [Clostridia bacterium]